MAKMFSVNFNGKTASYNFDKVDRDRLYGYIETEVLDDRGRKCELATLCSDGHTVVGKGDTGFAMLAPSGEWRERSKLRPVDPDGKPIVPVPSTFDAPVVLEQKASIDDYLRHNIHLVYQLSTLDDDSALRAELAGGTIFQFPFSYRGGLQANAGFLLQGADGNLFLLVGAAPSYAYVGLKQTAGLVTDETTDDEDDDALDFSMM